MADAAEPAVAAQDLKPGKVTPGHAPKSTARIIGSLPVVIALLVVGWSIALTEDLYELAKAEGGADTLDGAVQAWMLARRVPWLNTAATLYTDLGGKVGMPILAAITVAALARWWRTWTPVVVMLIATAGSLLMTTRGKVLTARARPPFEDAVPPLESSASFPSGHTLNAVVVSSVVAYLVLLYVASRLGRILTVAGLVLFCIGIGLSRVYLGHHWLTDVLAGAALGLAWTAAVIAGHWLFVRLRTKDRAPTVRAVAQQHRFGPSPGPDPASPVE